MYEREHEQQHKKELEEKSPLEYEDFVIKIEALPDTEITISSKDPCTCVIMAGKIIAELKAHDYVPKVVILP